MLRRLLLAATFLGAFTFAGVGVTDTAEAWRRWDRPYVTYYSVPRSYYYDDFYYGGYAPYRTYYYGPRVYRPYYGNYYYPGPGYYSYRPRSYVAFSVGF